MSLPIYIQGNDWCDFCCLHSPHSQRIERMNVFDKRSATLRRCLKGHGLSDNNLERRCVGPMLIMLKVVCSEII